MRRLQWFLDSPLRLGLTLSGILLAAFLVSEAALDRWPGIVQASRSGTLARRISALDLYEIDQIEQMTALGSRRDEMVCAGCPCAHKPIPDSLRIYRGR